MDVASVQLTLAVALAGLALGQLACGPLLDRPGRRAPLLAGLGLYLVASLACALAPMLPALVAARVMQALEGCAGRVITRAIVRDERGDFDQGASACLGSLLLRGMGLAPILGDQILLLFDRRAICAVLGVVALGARPRAPRSSRAAVTRARVSRPA